MPGQTKCVSIVSFYTVISGCSLKASAFLLCGCGRGGTASWFTVHPSWGEAAIFRILHTQGVRERARMNLSSARMRQLQWKRCQEGAPRNLDDLPTDLLCAEVLALVPACDVSLEFGARPTVQRPFRHSCQRRQHEIVPPNLWYAILRRRSLRRAWINTSCEGVSTSSAGEGTKLLQACPSAWWTTRCRTRPLCKHRLRRALYRARGLLVLFGNATWQVALLVGSPRARSPEMRWPRVLASGLTRTHERAGEGPQRKEFHGILELDRPARCVRMFHAPRRLTCTSVGSPARREF